MPVVLILLNVALAYLVGFLGRNRRLGFWGHFFCSLLLTPVIGILLIVATEPVKDIDKEKEEIKSLKEQIKALKETSSTDNEIK